LPLFPKYSSPVGALENRSKMLDQKRFTLPSISSFAIDFKKFVIVTDYVHYPKISHSADLLNVENTGRLQPAFSRTARFTVARLFRSAILVSNSPGFGE
jgi:hypothetical protein